LSLVEIKKPFPVSGFVFLTALLIRGVFVWWMNAENPKFAWDGDARDYQSYAVHLLKDGRYQNDQGDQLFRMPGYPVFLYSIYRFFGISPLAVQETQVLLGAFSCLLLFLIMRKLGGEDWGFFCGISLAILYDAIEPSAQILSEGLAIPLISLFWYLWFCWENSVGVKSAVLSLVCAALSFVRPEFGLFAVVLCLGYPPVFSKNSERQIKGWIWGAVFLAAFTPWMLRNWNLFHRLIPSSGQGEAGIYMGLALPLEHLGDISKSKRAPENLGSIEREEFYKKEFIQLWHLTPTLKIVKAYAVNALSVFYPFLPGYDWSYMLFVPLWLWAFFRIRHFPQLFPLWIMLVLYVSVHMLAGGPVSRYRQVLSPMLLIFATLGARDLKERFGKNFWKVFALWGGLNLSLWAFAPQVRATVLSVAALLKLHT
jgi:hypothetical protein